jgi:hypothetical protein
MNQVRTERQIGVEGIAFGDMSRLCCASTRQAKGAIRKFVCRLQQHKGRSARLAGRGIDALHEHKVALD